MNMNQNVMVSVICITYNQQDYIGEAIESFLMQDTDFDFEILIHDDASTDGTAEVVRTYQNRFPQKIHAVFQKENQYSKGVSPSKILSSMANGKYLAICEGDDYWMDKRKLQKQFDYMEAHPECSMYIHNGLIVSEDKKIIFNSKPRSSSPCIYCTEDAIKGLGIDVVTNSFFFRKYIVDQPEPNFAKIAPTGDYVICIINSFYGYIYYSPDTMSAHRALAKGSWSATCKTNPEKWIKYLEAQIKMLDSLDMETAFQYTDIINAEKVKQSFNIYFDLKSEKLKEEPYKILIKKIPIKRKIQYHLPMLFEILRRIAWKYRYFKVRMCCGRTVD